MGRVALRKRKDVANILLMQACYQSNPLGAESYREKVGGMRWDGKGATDV